MAHLDTAYKLGALQAQADFEQELNKMSAAPMPAAARLPPKKDVEIGGGAEATPAQHATGAPAAVVRPGPAAGWSKRTLAAKPGTVQ